MRPGVDVRASTNKHTFTLATTTTGRIALQTGKKRTKQWRAFYAAVAAVDAFASEV